MIIIFWGKVAREREASDRSKGIIVISIIIQNVTLSAEQRLKVIPRDCSCFDRYIDSPNVSTSFPKQHYI